MPETTKQKIQSAIQATDDQTLRTVLLLMLGMMEEIGDKIDSVLADEKSLRDTVLNGHAEHHDEDHEWIKAKRAEESRDAGSRRKIFEGLIEKALLAFGSLLIGWIAAGIIK